MGLCWDDFTGYGVSCSDAKMKLRHFILAMLAAALSNLAQAQDNCRAIETTDPKGNIWITAKKIMQPGEYCLTHDIKAPRVSDFSAGGELSRSGEMLHISASNVAIDLHGFTMNVEARGMEGVHLWHREKTPYPSHITIRNGTIKSRTMSAIELGAPEGSLLSDFKAIYESPQTPGMAERRFKKTLSTLPSVATAYLKTEYLIDRMKIEAGSVPNLIGIHRNAISMNGAANVIRNSTIEVTDGHAAIYLFGPNQLIEDNLIIFKGKAAVESAAAIKLHQADGTIIRNNDIII
jgi:hypothetical protein